MENYMLMIMVGLIFILIVVKIYPGKKKEEQIEEVEVIEEEEESQPGILITKDANGLHIRHEGFEDGEMVASLLVFSVKFAFNGDVDKKAFKQLVDNMYKTEESYVQQS